MCDFNLLNIDWTVERPTTAPGNKLMQLLSDNNLTQHVHKTIRQNNIYTGPSYIYIYRRTSCEPGNNRKHKRPSSNSIFNENRKWRYSIIKKQKQL